MAAKNRRRNRRSVAFPSTSGKSVKKGKGSADDDDARTAKKEAGDSEGAPRPLGDTRGRLLILAVLCAVFFHTPWAGAPRLDQVVYLHQVGQYHTLGDILSESPSWHRLHSAGDYILYRPVLFLFLGLQYYFFDYHFALWQITGFLLHAGTVLLFYEVCRKMALSEMWRVLITLLFGCSFLGSELVIWNHLTGYVLFALCTMASLNLLLAYLNEGGARLWWSLLFAALASFTYEAGLVYCAIVAAMLLFSRRRSQAILYFAVPVLYVIFSVLDYQAIFHHLPRASSDEHAPFPGLYAVAVLIGKQLVFWIGGFLAPAFYEVIPAGRATFAGFRFAPSFWRLLNLASVGLLLVGALTALFQFQRPKSYRHIWAAAAVLGFLGAYSAIIAVGRSVPRGLAYTLNSNLYYAYIPVLGLLLACAFLFGQVSGASKAVTFAAGILIVCNASKTFELIRGYRYEYSAPRLRLIDQLVRWRHDHEVQSNAFFEIAADCATTENVAWGGFRPHLRRGAVWKEPFGVADLLFPDRSYPLNREWLRGANIEKTVIRCGQAAGGSGPRDRLFDDELEGRIDPPPGGGHSEP